MNDLKEIGGFIVSADPYVNHDNSLSGNGTLTSPLGVVPGYNETVLWEAGDTVVSSFTTNEPVTNFNTFAVYDFAGNISYFDSNRASASFDLSFTNNSYWTTHRYVRLFGYNVANASSFNRLYASEIDITQTVHNMVNNYGSSTNLLRKVVGINRKQ